MARFHLASLLSAIAISACGSSDEPAPAGSPEPAATPGAEQTMGGTELAIRDFKYVPDTTTVAPGTEVEWTNEDDAPHTATADDGSFDTGDLREGDTGRVTLSDAGTYEYFCEFHKFMRARIEVR